MMPITDEQLAFRALHDFGSRWCSIRIEAARAKRRGRSRHVVTTFMAATTLAATVSGRPW